MHYPGIKLNWLDVSRHCPCYRHSSVETAYLLIASSRQPLQYLWPHLVRTGSRKGRWQIRQWKSSSTAEINSYSYPEGKGSRGTISPSAIVLQVELQVPILKQEREPWERGIDRPHLPHPTKVPTLHSYPYTLNTLHTLHGHVSRGEISHSSAQILILILIV